jgi:hypothetical protein
MKFPLSKIATTASLPCGETTVSFTRPFTIKHGIGPIPLRKESLLFPALQRHLALARFFEKFFGIKWRGLPLCD